MNNSATTRAGTAAGRAAGRAVGFATVLALSALSLSLVSAPAASAATDTANPALAGSVRLAPDAVDTTKGSADTTVSVPLSDNIGVTEATLRLTSPTGSTADVDLALDSGSAVNGVWTGIQTFAPALDVAGRWTPTALTASDAAGNTMTVTSGLGTGVVVTQTTDTAAPTLVTATSATDTVDTTADAGIATVRVQARDDLAGVAGGTVTFTSGDGDIAEGQLTGPPVLGTVNDGSWDVPVSFPVRSAPGVWRLSSIDLADAQYNDRTYTADDVQLPGLAVQVTADDDGDLPSLTSFGIGPATRSIAYGADGTVYAQVGFADAVSGVASVQVTLQRPNGVVDDAETQPVVLADTDLKTGTSRSGSVLVPVYVENFTAGVWKTASVVITDNAGNERTVATAQLPGTRTGFTVSTAGADTKAPTSSGVAFSPTSLDTRTGAADGTVLVAATDPDAVPSGIAAGTVTLTSPAGRETTADFTGDDLVAGDQAGGTFAARFSLPRNSESGAWTVRSVTVTDAAQRSATSTSWAAAPALTVLGRDSAPAAPPAAPAIGTATISGTSATVAWTAPSDNGGAVIRGYRVYATQSGGATTTVTAAGSPLVVKSLRRGASYTFTVAAENAAGVGAASPASNPVTVASAAPGAPTIGRAEPAGDTGAVVRWTPPSDDGGAALSGYLVTPLLNGVAQPAASAAADARTLTVPELARGRTYAFRVAAVNGAGTGASSQPSNTVSVAATVPAAPRVTTTSVTGNAITVRWAAPYDGGAAVTGYQVTGSPAGSCSSTATSCTVTGLTPDQAYSFVVVARNKIGNGSASTPSPSVAAGAVQRSTALSLAPLPATVAYGRSLTVAGTLTTSGAGLAGQTVTLQYRRANGNDAWRTFAQSRSTGGGAVRFAGFRPSQSLTVRLVAGPGAPYLASTSGVRTVAVTRQVTIGSSKKTVKRNRTVTIAGRATPARSGDEATLQRWSRGAWRAVARQRLTARGYSFRVKMAKRGTYSFRVVAVGSGFVPSASPSRALRIR